LQLSQKLHKDLVQSKLELSRLWLPSFLAIESSAWVTVSFITSGTWEPACTLGTHSILAWLIGDTKRKLRDHLKSRIAEEVKAMGEAG
jgi:hypothetical protein